VGRQTSLQQVEAQQEQQGSFDENRDPRHVVAAAFTTTRPLRLSRQVGDGLGH